MMMMYEDEDALTTTSSSEPLLSSPSPPPQQQPPHNHDIFLSLPLRILYGGIGMIMSFPSTALLYLVNTYIVIPVSLLPLYLSISFLPYSLKPSYAYVSTLLHGNNNCSTQMQMIFLLSTCGISYVVTAFIPQRAVMLCFILALARSVTLAWPNFLLDLCLLDEVDHIILLLSQPPPSPPPSSLVLLPQLSTLSYAEIAATLQSQAATCRSMGCVLANIVALILLAMPIWSTRSYNDKNHPAQEGSHNNDGMNHRMFQCILIGTGMVNFVCVIFLWHIPCRKPEPSSLVPPSFSNPTPSDDSLFILRSNHTANLIADDPTTIYTRLPSYDSVEEHRPSPENGAKISNHGGGLLEMNMWTVDSKPLLLLRQDDDTSRHQNNNAPSTNSDHHVTPDHGNAIWLVVSLQLLLVLLSMRESMVRSVTGKIGWTGTVMILTGLLLFSAYDLSSPWRRRRRNVADANGTFTVTQNPPPEAPMRVGLYLILRNAIPSVSYLMSSFIYTVYQERPFIIQLLSLLDMCVTTFACHIYSQYLSRYSSGRQLIWLIVITSVLSGVSSFGNVILIRLLDPKTTLSQQHHDSSMMIKMACTMVINAIMGFFDEWKFFPDVVLATVSSTTDRQCSSDTSSVSNVTIDATIPPNAASMTDRTVDGTTGDDTSSTTNNATRSSSSASSGTVRSVRYGTLISCIDLGDQIGLLLAGPLIAICHTTRSNDDDDHWEHLERLQIINSIMILLSTLLVFILIVRR